jgi:hypothetical protein
VEVVVELLLEMQHLELMQLAVEEEELLTHQETLVLVVPVS